jgi:hypothetical protein
MLKCVKFSFVFLLFCGMALSSRSNQQEEEECNDPEGGCMPSFFIKSAPPFQYGKYCQWER